jgi:hypothetical protein
MIFYENMRLPLAFLCSLCRLASGFARLGTFGACID